MLFRQKHRFSIRKFTFGVCSALLGTALIMGADSAKASETDASAETQPANSTSDSTDASPEDEVTPTDSDATEVAESAEDATATEPTEVTEPTETEAPSETSESTEASTTSDETNATESADKTAETTATEEKQAVEETPAQNAETSTSSATEEKATTAQPKAPSREEAFAKQGQPLPTGTYLRAAVEPVAQAAPSGTQVTPEVTVTGTHRGYSPTPTIFNDEGTTLNFGFGDQPLHKGDYFYVETQDVPVTLPRYFRLKSTETDGEGPIIAEVERVSYTSDYIKGSDSTDPSRFDLKNETLTTTAVKYKVTFTENVEGLKNVSATVSGKASTPTLATTVERPTQFKVKVNDKTVYTSVYPQPAWDDANGVQYKRHPYNTGLKGVVAQGLFDLSLDRNKIDYDNGNRTDLHAYINMEATVYDNRSDTAGSDVGFLTNTIGDGYVQLSGQVGGLPDGFLTTISSPTDPNKNTYTWDTDKIEIGKRLPVYYFPFQDIITGEKLANADGGKLYVTPDDMYYTVESISEDKKTITLRFHGDYTKPGRIINTFGNPMDDIATNMSTRLPVKFDNEKYNDAARWKVRTDQDGKVVLDENGKPYKDLTTDNSIVKVAKADGSELEEFVFKAESQYDSYGIEEVRQAGHGQTTSQVVHPEYDARATGVPIETSNPEQIDKGTVIVQYVDENGNVLKEEVQDVTDAEVDTEYDTVTDNRPQEITVGDQTYELVPAGDYNVGSVSDQGNLTTSKLRNVYGSTDAEGTEPTGTVTQGTKYVTYVYKEKPPVVKEGTVTVNYEDEEGNVIKDPVEDTPSSPVGTPYNTTDNRPEEIKTDDGKTYERIPDKTKGTEEGNVVEGNTDVTYVYKEVKGDVIVHYIDTEGNTIAKDETDTPLSSTGTAYDTSDDHMPETITKDGVTYELVPALTKGNEQGKVVKGTTEVTYVYKKVEPPVEAPTGDVIVHYVDEEGNKIAKDKVDTQGSKVDTPYDTTDNRPEKITTDDGKTYERIPEKTEGNEEGNVVEGTTEVTYVYKEVKGDVIVHYIDTEGNVIADDAVDTPETSTGTAYDTSDDHKPQTITKDGVTYELVPVLTKGNEQGKVVEGTTEVTYVYKKVEAPSTPEDPGMPPEETPNKYIPYIPEDPNDPKYDENVPPVDPNTGDPIDPVDYDETPEDPSDNPPLPDIDGHIPVDPEDPTTPLKPKDPNDPTKGYEPPKPVDPKEDTPVPYVPAGMVTVHYVDEDGNVIKDPTVDTPKSPVGTEYNTNENGEEIPKEITKDGKEYELVQVKDGDVEQGKVVKGNTDVTYIYKLKKQPEDPGMPPEETPNKYIPYIPEDPNDPKYDENVPPVDPNTGKPIDRVDYDETPEDPSDNPPLPDIDGHIPVDPEDPTKPLKPKDPNDPAKGYEPPKPVDPKKDTPVPYVPAGMVTVHYVDEDGNVIKDPTVDTPKSPVGTEYNTNENGEEIPKEITKDGKVYEYVKVKDGDKETGKVVKGNTNVTYIYKLKKQPENPGMPPEETPNKYIPYIPEDPNDPKYDENVPPVDPNTGKPIDPVDYDETPEDPSDNPPLPDIDGHIPVDPEDPTKPLKPKDPNDPAKGYEPPKPVDPKKDTPVPYVPAGMVTVHYVDENGNVIKDPTVDTPKSPVGTEYNTNENGEEIPKEIIGKDGKIYVLVKVKDGDKEKGKVVKGNTDVTYIYKLKEQPGKPGKPGKPGVPGTPEDPSTPPVDPKDEDPNTPPMDPGMPGQPSPDQPNNMEKPSKGLTDKDGKDMKPSDKMTEKELPETGNTNNPFVTTFGFLTLLAGMKLTKRNRREED